VYFGDQAVAKCVEFLVSVLNSLCSLKSANLSLYFSRSTAMQVHYKRKYPVKILKQKKCFRTGPVFLGGVCTCKINISLFGYIVGLEIIRFEFWLLNCIKQQNE